MGSMMALECQEERDDLPLPFLYQNQPEFGSDAHIASFVLRRER